MSGINESEVEKATLDRFASLGYSVEYGPGEPGAEREDYDQVVLTGRLQTALENINPNIPASAIEEVGI